MAYRMNKIGNLCMCVCRNLMQFQSGFVKSGKVTFAIIVATHGVHL